MKWFAKMRGLFLSLVFTCIALALAADDKVPIRLSALAQIPRERHTALVTNAITPHDSSPDISRKRRAYFTALKRLAEKLRKQNYWHDDFPSNVFAGIEERAAVLVATHYPASPGTGCSYVDMLRENYMNQMAEETIVSMAQQICIRSGDSDIRVLGQPSALDFDDWQQKWVSAGAVMGAPTPKANQSVQRAGASRSSHETNSTSAAAGSRR